MCIQDQPVKKVRAQESNEKQTCSDNEVDKRTKTTNNKKNEAAPCGGAPVAPPRLHRSVSLLRKKSGSCIESVEPCKQQLAVDKLQKAQTKSDYIRRCLNRCLDLYEDGSCKETGKTTLKSD